MSAGLPALKSAGGQLQKTPGKLSSISNTTVPRMHSRDKANAGSDKLAHKDHRLLWSSSDVAKAGSTLRHSAAKENSRIEKIDAEQRNRETDRYGDAGAHTIKARRHAESKTSGAVAYRHNPFSQPDYLRDKKRKAKKKGSPQAGDGPGREGSAKKGRGKRRSKAKGARKGTPGYARPSKSAARRHRRPANKLRRQWEDDVRFASRIGGSDAHAAAGVGEFQRADTDDLHRQRSRQAQQQLDAYERTPTIHVAMGHTGWGPRPTGECRPLPAVSAPPCPPLYMKNVFAKKKNFLMTHFEQQRRKWRRQVRARFEARMRARGLWS